MATINVVDDHGAVGDGVTDDRQAIQDAIDAANTGDTVLIPSTTDYYMVDHGADGQGGTIQLENAADNITITGEGAGSKIVNKVDDGNDSNCSTFGTADGVDSYNWTSMTIKNMIIDGGWNDYQNLWSSPFQTYNDNTITGLNLVFEDVVFQWASYDENSTETDLTGARGSSGFSFAASTGVSYVTLQNCTARDNGQHGFNPNATGEGTPSDPEFKMYDCKSVRNGDQETTGTPLDINGGNVLVDRFYASTHQYALKAGTTLDNVDYFKLKDVHVRDTNNKGIKTQLPDSSEGSHTYEMDWDNVYVENVAQEGLEIRGDYTMNVTNSIMCENCNTDGDSDPDDFFQLIEDGVLNADNATFIAQNASGTDSSIDGIRYGASGSGSLGQYYYYNIPSAVNNNGNLNISNGPTNEEQSMLDVPGANDVGAFNGTTVHDTRFSEYATGSVPSDWSPQWHSSSSDWNVASKTSNFDDQVLELDASSGDRYALSWDEVGPVSSAEILALVRFPSYTDTSTWSRLYICGGGDSQSEEAYYTTYEYDDSAGQYSFSVYVYSGGSTTGIGSIDVADPSNEWRWVRFRFDGTSVQAKEWTFSENEPTAWDIDQTDSTLSSGWIGVGGYPTDLQEWDYVGVGTGGAEAPAPSEYFSFAVWKSIVDGTQY